MSTFVWILISIAAILYWRMCFRWAVEEDEGLGVTLDTWGKFWGEVVMVTFCSFIIPMIPFFVLSDYLKAKKAKAVPRRRRFDPTRAARVIGGETRRAKIKRLEAKNAEAQKVIREFEAGRI